MNSKKIYIKPGETAARYFRRVGKLSAASRLGIQRKVDNRWEDIPLSYRAVAGDRIRIRGAVGGSIPAAGLKDLVRRVVLFQKAESK